ncbi:hypothetical protein ABPG77_005034 [Micractinium sp. CCAP 211/92]
MRIAVWFFKGGVGKTTMSVNVAAQLAKQGKNVALLDFDGQCNVTSMLIPPPECPDEEESSDDEEVDDLAAGGGDEPPIFHDKPKAVCAFPLEEFNQRLVPNAYTALSMYVAGSNDDPCLDLSNVKGYDSRFWVLPGSERLFEHDSALAAVNSNQLNSINALGGFNKYCTLIEKKYKLDFIVVDLSPGASALTRTVIMSCDYLLPPLAADFFSLASAQAMLYNVIPRWLQWHDELIDRQVELRAGLDAAAADRLLWFGGNTVKILPFLISGYKIMGLKGEVNLVAHPDCLPLSITKADSQWVHSITDLLNDSGATPVPVRVHQRLVPNTGRDGVTRHVIPFLKNIGSICQFR